MSGEDTYGTPEPAATVADATFVIVANETGYSRRWLATDEDHARKFARAVASHGHRTAVYALGGAR